MRVVEASIGNLQVYTESQFRQILHINKEPTVVVGSLILSIVGNKVCVRCLRTRKIYFFQIYTIIISVIVYFATEPSKHFFESFFGQSFFFTLSRPNNLFLTFLILNNLFRGQ